MFIKKKITNLSTLSIPFGIAGFTEFDQNVELKFCCQSTKLEDSVSKLSSEFVVGFVVSDFLYSTT